MTQEQLKQLILTIDPTAKKYYWNSSGENYTLWTPHHYGTQMSDDRSDDTTVQVTIDRYTKNDKDTVIFQIQSELEERNVTTGDVMKSVEEETDYIHFILECFVTP